MHSSPNFNGVCAGDLPLAIVEVQRAHAVEYQLHCPHVSRAAVHPQYDLMGLLPIDDQRELLGEMQYVLVHAQVHGDTELKPGEVDGDGLGRRCRQQGRRLLTLASLPRLRW
jgi:hypothetical protein